MDYQEAIAYIETLPDMERGRFGSGISMTLDSMKALLSMLGNPERKTKTIHITGSKGKGSTAVMIASILQAAGFRTALFTSPHLHSYRERIAFDLEPVTEVDFALGIAEIKKITENAIRADKAAIESMSTFGVLTALFFFLTAKRTAPVDWQIVEVGLGGKDDATNVFLQKDLAVFTAISLEHTALLGDSIRSIAEHKAGIITAGAKVILGRQKDAIVKHVLESVCAVSQARLLDVCENYFIEHIDQSAAGERFSVRNQGAISEYSLSLNGLHQIDNALCAIAAVDALSESGHRIEHQAKAEGLLKANIKGRFEVVALEPNALEGKRLTWVVDGAHNADSADALSQTLRRCFGERKCIFIIGMNSDKNVEAFWSALSGRAQAVITTQTDNRRALAPDQLASRISACDSQAKIYTTPDISAAKKLALELADNQGLICVSGSLYVVAELRHRHIARCSESKG